MQENAGQQCQNMLNSRLRPKTEKEKEKTGWKERIRCDVYADRQEVTDDVRIVIGEA